jgi:hypothetical protein
VKKLARITKVETLGAFAVRLTFTDGVVRELDLEPMLGEGVLASLHDPAVFAQVAIDPVAGTVSWPNGIDFDPDVLHGDHEPASGSGPRVLSQHRLSQTG